MRKTIQYRNVKKLWVAHLKLAILDLNGKNTSLKRDADKYINSDNPNFPSFCAICEILDQNPELLRIAIFKNQLRKKDFCKKYTVQCCECGKRYPIAKMQKLNFYWTYVCGKCKHTCFGKE